MPSHPEGWFRGCWRWAHHDTVAVIGWGTVLTLVGIACELLAIAYLVDYRGIARRTQQQHASQWEPAPLVGRYMAGRIDQIPLRRSKVIYSFVFLPFGTVVLALGIYVLASLG